MLNLTMSQSKVKEERHDEAEIRELAAKMMEQHKVASAKAAQIQLQNQQQNRSNIAYSANGQQNMMNYMSRKPGTTTTSTGGSINSIDAKTKLENGDDKKPCDDESQRGHFGWATFGKVHIPYILRQGEKYCAVRMIELKLLNKYLSYLHQDIYSCTCVRSYYITEAEARLINEINVKHCESQFGRELFTIKDLVVRMSDANKFYQFLDVCYKKLLMGTSGPSDKCGFIRINKESVVPYTVRENQQFVPLFYFEGETDNLKLKAESLSGWDLSYLKFCCKVQGIRNELFASDSVAVISLTDIKSYFPNGTEFEEYWPAKVVEQQLLIGANSQKLGNNSVQWTRQPAAPPPKTNNIPNLATLPKTNQNSTTASTIVRKQQQQQQQHQQQQQASSLQYQNPMLPGAQRMQASLAAAALNPSASYNETMMALSGVLSQQAFNPNVITSAHTEFVRQLQAQVSRTSVIANTNNHYGASEQQHQSQNRGYSQRSNQMVGNRQSYQSYGNSPLNLNAINQRIQQPPPLVPTANQNNLNTVDAVNLHRRQLLQQQQQQQQQHMSIHPQMSPQPAHQSPVSTADTYNGVKQIPEVKNYNAHIAPYKLQRMVINERPILCINRNQYAYSDCPLMSLSDVRELYFRNMSLDNCKQNLSVLGIEFFMGNRHQYQTFKEAGKNVDAVPFVHVQDIAKYQPQLDYLAHSSHLSQNPKRVRIS